MGARIGGRRYRRVWCVCVNADPEGGEADINETRLEHRPRRVAHVLVAARARVSLLILVL